VVPMSSKDKRQREVTLPAQHRAVCDGRCLHR
jgi:hypothetical protein